MPKSKSREVEIYDTQTGHVFGKISSISQSKRLGFKPNKVKACCIGKARCHHGYGFRYVDALEAIREARHDLILAGISEPEKA